MQKRDTLDVICSATAVGLDALTVFAGFLGATWLRFDSGWFAVPLGRDPHLYPNYAAAASVTTLLFLFIFRALDLYVRPQLGRFESRIPRLVRACGLGILLTMVLAFAVQNEVEFSRLAIALAFGLITLAVLLERYLAFRVELHFARHSTVINRVLILGTDSVAVHLKRSLEREPKLRTRVTGFLRADLAEPDPQIPPDQIFGTIAELPSFVSQSHPVDQVILTASSLNHQQIVDLILFCEQNLVTFNMVPDIFRILTSGWSVQTIDDIPLLGVSPWPLDRFWNRLLKRAEDVVGATVGLLLAGPVIGIAALLIRRASPGPAIYRQERCGEKGRVFMLYKLRTMRQDAEAGAAPGWTVANDPRRTAVGVVLRRFNIDELPQLWNVLKGDMSLVGPRPERPHFVNQFKEDVARYMWRHVSKPGLTGWAQVNGLRGNTSIEERVKYDLYYLENWSLAFDFKILAMTVFAHENAY